MNFSSVEIRQKRLLLSLEMLQFHRVHFLVVGKLPTESVNLLVFVHNVILQSFDGNSKIRVLHLSLSLQRSLFLVDLVIEGLLQLLDFQLVQMFEMGNLSLQTLDVLRKPVCLEPAFGDTAVVLVA